MTYYTSSISLFGSVIDALGVIIIVVGALLALYRFVIRGIKPNTDAYRLLRQDLGKAILLGLEFLIAGDIIRTVVLAPTMANVLVLGVIVVIRTFLSMTLQLEIDGRWPWQQAPANKT